MVRKLNPTNEKGKTALPIVDLWLVSMLLKTNYSMIKNNWTITRVTEMRTTFTTDKLILIHSQMIPACRRNHKVQLPVNSIKLKTKLEAQI